MAQDTSGNVRTPPEGWLSVSEAARLAGINIDTMRKRASRGAVLSRKVEGRWYIDPDSMSGHVQEAGGKEPDTEGHALLRELVETQRRTIDILTAELGQVHHEVRSLHEHLDRLTRALPKPEEENEGVKASKPRRPRWWPW